ncbi:11935_t:CDS:2, partial [Racocetra fulgida]
GPLFILSMKNGENRFNTTFIQEINAILDEIEFTIQQENLERAALITIGEGKFYSNGLDLEHALNTPGFFDDYFLKLLARILTFPIPTVAAINGHAFAGGFMFAIAHVDIIAPEKDVLPKAKELALEWSKLARAGAIYRELKKEMYIE